MKTEDAIVEAATARTMVVGTGVVLRALDDGGPNVILQRVTPRTSQVWRVVPRAQLARHIEEWADEQGISLPDEPGDR